MDAPHVESNRAVLPFVKTPHPRSPNIVFFGQSFLGYGNTNVER